MKLALISDVHANLEALEAVLQSIDGEGVDLIVHLGDLVGYNANPNECIDLIRQEQILCVAGNHDRAVIDINLAQDFNIIAYQSIIWSGAQLTAENRIFLQELPITRLIGDRFLACHGTPVNPDAYISYLFQGKRVFNMLRRELQPVVVCLFGHTHRRAVWRRDIRGKIVQLPISEQRTYLTKDNLYLINPGSVGQPRNQIPLASYAVFDTDEYWLHFKLVPYNIRFAQKKILAANLPPYLAERLAYGV
ncbi:metallophosphoesterase family protein [Desulfobacca acetoxidans]|uniref:Phosphodiesterase, MJ0936 family n=1 Tax=Desulfobacca acetoxidans (strain ATCC 700848 / DSM 11109 / ASRB2) TaxID=880072 RepID=F2NHX8_DESAR|nr:metallophosphoesterase family protein [Desulfobacca acetoxidans]AEB09604.1 phosphodiesterase, MJ0936 family [Desulfobacca acetoxidans DSM 11109]HAY21588.1 metallophosphoesterase [Desulfobacterales bacterium]